MRSGPSPFARHAQQGDLAEVQAWLAEHRLP
jgi:hypothetical protein